MRVDELIKHFRSVDFHYSLKYCMENLNLVLKFGLDRMFGQNEMKLSLESGRWYGRRISYARLPTIELMV